MEKVILEDNEKQVIDSAYKSFKKEHKRIQPSVQTNEVVTEGLKFFKTSPRLYRLALKLEKRSKQNPQLEETVKKINALANKFEYVEDLYDVGKKQEAKVQYKSLMKAYSDVIKLLKKDDTIEALKKTGSLAITIASMCIPYMAMQHFFPQLSIQAVNNAASSEANPFKTAGLYLKRAGAFTLCGIPTRIARSGFNLATDEIQSKALKSVDRMLDSKDVDYSEYDDDELHQLT